MELRTNAPVARKANATIKLTVAASVSLDLRVEAKRRGVTLEALAATIIEAVVSHNLYAAVLDH